MKTITIETVAMAIANPGLAAIGVRIVAESGEVLHEDSTQIGNATATTAAFAAVSFGLEAAATYFDNKPPAQQYRLTVTDEVVKEQLSGERVVQDPGLVPHFMQIYNLRVEYFRELEVLSTNESKNKELLAAVKATLDAGLDVA